MSTLKENDEIEFIITVAEGGKEYTLQVKSPVGISELEFAGCLISIAQDFESGDIEQAHVENVDRH